MRAKHANFLSLTTLGLVVLLATSGCASVVSGNKQTVAVLTTHEQQPVTDAICKLTNDKGQWEVDTPGTVEIQSSFQDLQVLCDIDSHEPGTATFVSSTKPAVFGNIIIGGAIGAAVDVSTGAAFQYPLSLSVPLGKPTGRVATKREIPPVSEELELSAGDVLIYEVEDRFTGAKREARWTVLQAQGRNIKFGEGDRHEKPDGTVTKASATAGDMDLFEPPTGWSLSGIAPGSSWSRQYAVKDDGFDAKLSWSAYVEGVEIISLGAMRFEAYHVEYRGTAARFGGTTVFQHGASFTAWLEKSSSRVLRFDSNISGSLGSQAGKTSRERVQLLRVVKAPRK